MNNNYILKLKEKFKLEEETVKIIENFFNKLIEFGYISNIQKNKYEKKLYQNIDNIITINNNNNFCFNNKLYDPIKKTIYITKIKTSKDLKYLYLNLLFAIICNKHSDTTYSIGFCKYIVISKIGEISRHNFAMNFAICSNLVCRLIDTKPTFLSINSFYKKYNLKIFDKNYYVRNDMFKLEDYCLNILNYAFSFNIEDEYSDLFKNNPYVNFTHKLSNNFLSGYIDLVNVFDIMSLQYNNLTQLKNYEMTLNNKYIKNKKYILNYNENILFLKQNINISKNSADSITNTLDNDLEKQITTTKHAIIDYLEDLSKINLETFEKKKIIKSKKNNKLDEDIEKIEVNTGLSENIQNLNDFFKNSINKFQNIILDYLLQNKNKYMNIEFCTTIKNISSLFILPNISLKKLLSDEIFSTFMKDNVTKINNNIDENDILNSTLKIKYSLIYDMLNNPHYINYDKKITYSILESKINKTNDYKYILINKDDKTLKLARVFNLNLNINDLENNVLYINAINFKNLQQNLKDKLLQLINSNTNNLGLNISDYVNTNSTNNIYISYISNNNYLIFINELNNIKIFELNILINPNYLKDINILNIFSNTLKNNTDIISKNYENILNNIKIVNISKVDKTLPYNVFDDNIFIGSSLYLPTIKKIKN